MLQNLINLLGIPSSLNVAVSGSVILIRVLAGQEYADFRTRRDRLQKPAADRRGRFLPPKILRKIDKIGQIWF